jgi:hypothetical protein
MQGTHAYISRARFRRGVIATAVRSRNTVIARNDDTANVNSSGSWTSSLYVVSNCSRRTRDAGMEIRRVGMSQKTTGKARRGILTSSSA